MPRLTALWFALLLPLPALEGAFNYLRLNDRVYALAGERGQRLPGNLATTISTASLAPGWWLPRSNAIR